MRPIPTIEFIDALREKPIRIIYLLLGIITILVLLVVTLGFVLGIINRSDLKIEQIPGQSLQITIGQNIAYRYLLSASELWASTGIELTENDIENKQIKIYASGRFNPSVHRLCESAETDSLPGYSWLGPEGDRDDWCKKYVESRQEGLLVPTGTFGVLVAGISDNADVPPDDPCAIWPIGNEWLYRKHPPKSNCGKIVKKIPKAGFLWFAVNDIRLPMDESGWELFKKDPSRRKNHGDKARSEKEWRKRWDYIRINEYENIWFDDNIGNLMITVTIN